MDYCVIRKEEKFVGTLNNMRFLSFSSTDVHPEIICIFFVLIGALKPL